MIYTKSIFYRLFISGKLKLFSSSSMRQKIVTGGITALAMLVIIISSCWLNSGFSDMFYLLFVN